MTHATASDHTTTSVGCRRCGLPLGWHVDVVSTHDTSDGETIYSRCGACGLLQIWTRPDHLSAAELLTRRPVR